MHTLRALGVRACRWKHVSGYHPRWTIENQTRDVGAQENVSRRMFWLVGRLAECGWHFSVSRALPRGTDRRYSPATDFLSSRSPIDLSLRSCHVYCIEEARKKQNYSIKRYTVPSWRNCFWFVNSFYYTYYFLADEVSRALLHLLPTAITISNRRTIQNKVKRTPYTCLIYFNYRVFWVFHAKVTMNHSLWFLSFVTHVCSSTTIVFAK